MSNRLVLELDPLEHPFPLDPGSRFEMWGRIRLILSTEEQELILLDWQWDILPLAEWFTRNHSALCSAAESVGGIITPSASESLAQTLDRVQQREFSEFEDEEADEWFAYIFRFREQHAFRFALRGTDIPDIVIGINRRCGEISHCNDTCWSYEFDMNLFCENAQHNIRRVLEHRCRTTDDAAVQETIAALLQLLREQSDG